MWPKVYFDAHEPPGMDVLVTGGHGALGTYVVDELLNRGHLPTVFDRMDDPDRRADVGYDYIEGDITDPELIETAAVDHDVIIHLAALKRPACEADPRLATQVNVEGTINVFDAAVSADATVVQVSSKSVFGHITGDYAYPTYRPLDEGAPKAQTGDIYGLTKAATEAYRESYVTKHGLNAASFRFASSFGPGKVAVPGKGMLVPSMIEGVARGKSVRVSGGDELNDWIYFADIANGLVDAATAGEFTYPVYHIGTGRAESLRDFASVLEEAFPDADIDVAGGRNPQEQDRPMYARLDISRARADFDYYPRYTLRTAIAAYLDRLGYEHDLG